MFGLMSGSSECQPVKLKPGDLLFRGATSGKLSQAIDQVTQTGIETHFSHMGLVEVRNGSIFVLHASPEDGTCRISLHEFLHPEGEPVEVVAYRLKQRWQKAVPAALSQAESMLGKPYNNHYMLVDTAYYCSDFVYRAFAADSVFELDPMTFKDPRTGRFSPGWVEHYRKLGMEIPEGLPGCNPNGMAASSKLERLGIVLD
ncbi:MAG: YiiX/YebB-like N1pC/P60 family cysteine hydrolase [Prolixibacteraceae bacterium]